MQPRHTISKNLGEIVFLIFCRIASTGKIVFLVFSWCRPALTWEIPRP
jgi:hypothetical protein